MITFRVLFFLFARDVGFTGKTVAVIRHALRLLEDDVTITESPKDSENAVQVVQVYVQPKLVLPHVLNLLFYSNLVKMISFCLGTCTVM